MAAASGRAGLVADRYYFDERFAEARRRAGYWSGSSLPIPVQGDVTAIWVGGLARASIIVAAGDVWSHHRILLFLSARSFSNDQARAWSDVSRIDRDLHLWTIRTDHSYYKHGTPA